MEVEASALDADQSTEGLTKEARRAARKASLQGGDTASDLVGAKERPQRRNRKLKHTRNTKNLSEAEQHQAAATSVAAAYRGKKGREKADNEAEAEAVKQLQACRRASRTRDLRVSLEEGISA